MVGSALLVAASQPDWGAWPLAFVALMPLLHGLRGRTLGARLLVGFCAGSLAGLFVVGAPMVVAISSYFGTSLVSSAAGSLALATLFGGVPFVVFAALAGEEPDPIRVAAAWALSEWTRGWLATGMPWALLSHSLVPVPVLLGAAALGGAWLVSGLLAMLSACLLDLVSGFGSRRGAALLAALGVLALVAPALILPARPGVRLAEGASAETGWVRVGLVQTVDPGLPTRSPAEAAAVMQQAVRNSPAGAALVVWPESAVRFVLPENRGRLATLLASTPPGPGRWLVGAPRSGERGRLSNAAVLVDRSGAERGYHEKTVLVPFTERPVPWLQRLVGRDASTRAGQAPSTVAVQGLRFGPLVCFESLFPAVARRSVIRGADVLVNLTNDAWFGDSRGLDQHFAAGVLRAVETGRPLLRSAHGGTTAAVDGQGRVVARVPRGASAALLVDVAPSPESTLYTRLGDAALLWAPTWILASSLRRRARSRPGTSTGA